MHLEPSIVALIPARSGSKLDMLPDIVLLNIPDSWAGDTERLCNSSLRQSIFTGTNNHYLFIRELRPGYFFSPFGYKQSKAEGMECIVTTSAIFQIVNTIVCRVAIYMINLVVGWFGAKERSSYELMHFLLQVAAFCTQIYSHSRVFSKARFNRSANEGSFPGTAPSNVPPIRNFIPSLKADNWSPFFRMLRHPLCCCRIQIARFQLIVELMFFLHIRSIPH